MDGRWTPAAQQDGFGLMYRPVVTQVSRWDRLKGFRPLLDAFVALKRRRLRGDLDPRHRRRLQILRLVLAGPDPAAVADDPEGRQVLDELSRAYLRVPQELAPDIALLTLPMQSRKQNALMVNALQRCSTVIVQNSVQEGFGLTVTEAMWKRIPVIGTQACGLRQQIRDGIDGRLTAAAEDVEGLTEALDSLLADPAKRELFGRSAQRRVHDHFLVFTQARQWVRNLANIVREQAG